MFGDGGDGREVEGAHDFAVGGGKSVFVGKVRDEL